MFLHSFSISERYFALTPTKLSKRYLRTSLHLVHSQESYSDKRTVLLSSKKRGNIFTVKVKRLHKKGYNGIERCFL